MIEIKNEQIAPLPENMAERYKELYRLQDTLGKSFGCTSPSIDIRFFDGDDRKIRSITLEGLDENGNKVCCFKNYYRNGQLSEGGITRNGKYEQYLSFYCNGESENSPLAQKLREQLQNGRA